MRVDVDIEHIPVREPVIWYGTHKGQFRIGFGVPVTRGETGCTFWVVEQH